LIPFFRNMRRVNEQRPAAESSSISIVLPCLRFASTRYLPALVLWDRRCRTSRGRVDRSTFRCRTKLVAGVAVRPDRLRKLSLSIAVILCRQRPSDQSRLAHRGWLVKLE